MECQKREGKRQCPWWVAGCINPKVSPEVKVACSDTFGRLPRKELVKA